MMANDSYLLPASVVDSGGGKSSCPWDFLYEALLWRGFLTARDERGGIFLLHGSHNDDLAVLVDLRCVVKRLDDEKYLASVSLGSAPSSQVPERILSLAPKNHPTGQPRYLGTTAVSFFACQYGFKCSTIELDPGVALLVKSLPVCGTRTVLSCQGHPGAMRRWPAVWPEIYFYTKYDLQWTVMLFEELGGHLPEFTRLTWKVIDNNRRGWLAYRMIFCPAENSPHAEPCGSEYTDVLVRLQMAARRLLDPQVYTPIRAAKHSTTIFEELRGALRNELTVLG